MQAQISIRLPEELKLEATQIAHQMRLKLSDIVRLALEQYLREPQVHEDLAPYGRVKHLIGSVRSGIVDLGTSHREHLVRQIRRHG